MSHNWQALYYREEARAEAAEAERDLLREELGHPDDPESWVTLRRRVLAAEAKLAEVSAAYEAAVIDQTRLGAAEARGDYWRDERERTGELLVAAEARVTELEAALRKIEGWGNESNGGVGYDTWPGRVARAALAPKEDA